MSNQPARVLRCVSVVEGVESRRISWKVPRSDSKVH